MGLHDAVVTRLGRVGAAGGRERGAMPLVCDLCVVPCSGSIRAGRHALKGFRGGEHAVSHVVVSAPLVLMVGEG